MKLAVVIAMTCGFIVGTCSIASADTAYFARYGYDYPPAWGIGPFETLTDCQRQSSSLYGADAYKWHCELRTYVGVQDNTPYAPSYSPQNQKYFARYGYDFPAYWGAGPFDSLQQCMNLLGQIYGADAYKWHCELHL
jgi:hypothetical protein